ncbi:YvrJ family protein [Sporolactobacillus shoreicorticis]|uniref:YvrJ family protein n=1 Tax=Sporolactobacillus shoreicorticis TaxID=1923877 RepID=A0ABW5S5I6_9BACL|nr:YvrJ family protein [Sporolactobacillus shoreicorticis]MCO7127384.1 YvrJ family protein [Sporolactobacillus shoreicorticis]
MDFKDLPVWVNVLGNIGFPIVITSYLLLRFEKKLDLLSDSILQLKTTIDTSNNKVEKN